MPNPQTPNLGQVGDVLEGLADPFCLLERDGLLTYLNPQAERLLGKDRADLLGKPLWQELPEPLGPALQDACRKVAGGGAPLRTEALHPARQLWYEVHTYPAGAGLAIHFRDISERKRAQQQAAQMASVAAENARLYEEVREVNRHKDEFLAMLGHELRNPLAPIRNALHVLRLQGGTDPLVVQMGTMMERQLRHLVRLVDDLLDVARIARGKVELRKEIIELGEVLRRTLEAERPGVEERQHRLEVELPAEPLRLEADPARLEQVIANLLTNAVKYTAAGGQIRVSSCREGGEAVLRVRDNGIGIRPENLARIFEMFAQGDPVAGRRQEGLGLGLTLVKSLVEMHGGSVAAFSDGPGTGSEFVVRLPLLVEAGKTADQPPPPAERQGTRVRILVVDDNADAAKTLALLLRVDGHEVRVTHDGTEALATAQDFLPEVVLLDIGLPGIDGYEVARRLRNLDGMQGTALIALTGFGQEEDRRRSGEAGFQAHLVKPLDPSVLRQLLGQIRAH